LDEKPAGFPNSKRLFGSEKRVHELRLGGWALDADLVLDASSYIPIKMERRVGHKKSMLFREMRSSTIFTRRGEKEEGSCHLRLLSHRHRSLVTLDPRHLAL